jgi:hypothetical protein
MRRWMAIKVRPSSKEGKRKGPSCGRGVAGYCYGTARDANTLNAATSAKCVVKVVGGVVGSETHRGAVAEEASRSGDLATGINQENVCNPGRIDR